MAATMATQTSIEPPSASAAPCAEPSPEDVAPSLRARLRHETRPAHERLDASVAGLAEGDPAKYGLFLRMNEACHGALEPLLAASPLAGHRPPSGSPHAAVLSDVEAMGIRRLVPAPFPVANPTLAQAVGIAYVLEGSKLGARQILRRLRIGSGEETDRLPVAFLSQAAAGVDGFKGFLELAEALVVTSSERDAAVGAADATFEYFLDAMRRASADGDAAVG